MKKIFIILFCLLITSPAYAGTTPLFDLWKFPAFKKGKLIKIPSYNSGPFPNEFMSLKDGSYKKSEITGPAFDPSGTRLYFSSQRGKNGFNGITYEVTGPFDTLT